MKEINTYIHEARERQSGGRFQNAGSDIDNLIWDWLIKKYCMSNGKVLTYMQTSFDRVRGELITPDHTICKMVLQKTLGTGLFELGIEDENLSNGELPSYIRFDKPLYAVNIYTSGDLKSLDNFPMITQKLNIQKCPRLNDLEGLPGMKKLTEVYIDGCYNLKSLRGLENLRHARELIIKNCPELRNIDEISKCKVSGDSNGSGDLQLIHCPNLDVTTGVISKITKGSKDMSISLDRRMLEDLREANMYHEFDGIEGIRYFNVHDAGNPDTAYGLLEDMIPWDRLANNRYMSSRISRIRLYGCSADRSCTMHGANVVAMTVR